LNSNKRKREPPSKHQDESSEPVMAAATIAADPGHENGLRASSADEQEDLDPKRARRKEKKERQNNRPEVDDSTGNDLGHNDDTSIKLEKKRKKKKAKADTRESRTADAAVPGFAKIRDGLDIDEKVKMVKKERKTKKKRKDKDTSTAEKGDDSGHRVNSVINGEDQPRNGANRRPQVDDDTKGGVEPIEEDAFDPPAQSADQNKQHRRKYDTTSDNDWLRRKTNRVLDLMDGAPQNTPSAFLEPEEGSIDATANQEVRDTEQTGKSSTNLPTSSLSNSSPSSGRLFVRNLPYTAEESDIEGFFSKYGHLDEVRLAKKPLSPLSFHDDRLIGTTYASHVMSFQRSILVDISCI
jgi:RNA recognition motif. (a.k.a. RRM, RBD, or RNP domain)